MKLNSKAAIPVDLPGIRGLVFGGPYREYDPDERRLVGVKMAEEIAAFCHVSIPTEDFSVPSNSDMHLGLVTALSHMRDGNDLYAGCMGGIGRTGLFMGCLAKVLIEFYNGSYRGFTDPVLLVRGIYKAHAIETAQQMAFVRGFDALSVLEELGLVTAPVDTPEPQSELHGVQEAPQGPASVWTRLVAAWRALTS